MTDLAEQLSAVRFDKYGTPDRKLPACPQCEEDELYAGGTHWRCYRCNWTQGMST